MAVMGITVIGIGVEGGLPWKALTWTANRPPLQRLLVVIGTLQPNS